MPHQEPVAATQARYEVRLDWGVEGLRSIAPGAGVIVVVDVLSFSTTVERAAALGVAVVPFDGEGDAATAAEGIGAVLAGPRDGAGLTLSPSSMTPERAAGVSRLLLPSPNGSRLSAEAARYGVPVVAAGLRNRAAVARWVLGHQERIGRRAMVAVVAAGERWADGSGRVAIEDQLGAGAVVDALQELGVDACSPEAALAAAGFAALRRAVGHLLTASVSGQELIAAGHADDVRLAAQLDASTVVPVLTGGAFVAA